MVLEGIRSASLRGRRALPRGGGMGRMSDVTQSVGRVAGALLALAFATAASASAGNGIRLGGSEGRMHPFLELEGRYDSNVFYVAEPTIGQKSVGDLILHVRPGFDLAVPGELVVAEAGGSLDWAQYLGLESADTRKELSKLYGQASLGLKVNPRGVVGFELDDEFRRAQGTTALVLSNAVISNSNALRVRVPFRPGGGALVLTANGAWQLETYERYFAGAPDPTGLGYNEYRAGGEIAWRFLPRTAAILEGAWFSRVPEGSGLSTAGGVEVQGGVKGLVTPHLGATVEAGYTSSLGVDTGNLKTWMATLEAEWIATDSARVKAGWRHGLGIDPGPSLYTSNRVYGGGRILLAGRYGLKLDVDFEQRSYDRIVLGTVVSTSSSSADVVRVEPALDAAVARWMTASVGYAYSKRTSSFSLPYAAQVPGFAYSKNEAWLRLNVRY